MHHYDMTLEKALEIFMKSLKDNGSSPRTQYTYGKDCEQIKAFFGADKKMFNILPAHVARFYQSDALLKVAKSGKDRAPATINKTKRVFLMFLVWSQKQGYIDTLPIPKNTQK